ncbi:MAG: hypothetical protein MZU84_00820 [Sphingobacterium sp.]|nr:hypothetical protein [Sphingobacterium sp.]
MSGVSYHNLGEAGLEWRRVDGRRRPGAHPHRRAEPRRHGSAGLAPAGDRARVRGAPAPAGRGLLSAWGSRRPAPARRI